MRTESIGDRERWLDELERAARFTDTDLVEALARLTSEPAVSMSVLTGEASTALTCAARTLTYRRARSEVGKPEARVYQEFGYCGTPPPEHPVSHLGAWFEQRLHRALALMPDPPLNTDFTINDIVCQEYRPGDLGITPHRDHVSYTGLIVLVVLGGRGRYFVCADRQGNGKREIAASAGWAILMPGPGFGDRTDRPFHMVGGITALRYSVGLRHDARKIRRG